MKLRIFGNSVRLRLGPDEVDRLAADGSIVETTTFAPGETLICELRSADVPHPRTQFSGGAIRVTLQRSTVREWARSDDVGIRFEQPIDSGALRVLVEKDFECLHPPVGEAQSPAFPHPRQQRPAEND